MANQLLKDAVHANALTSKQGMLERLFTLAFSGLVYPQIWEDPEVDMAVLDLAPGKPWGFDALNEWLYKPSAYVPGTRMSFAGITNDKQRADVIAYLRPLSDHPVPLPEAKPAAAPAARRPSSR